MSENENNGDSISSAQPPPWFWFGETNWEPYSKSINDKLENGFQSKKKEVKVDDQRFVDLEEMIQKRYDDHTKKRVVRRGLGVEVKTTDILDPYVFLVIGNHNTVNQLIETNGGLISAHLTKRVTHIVVCGDDPLTVLTAHRDLIEKMSPTTKVVNFDFVKDCVSKGKKLSSHPYEILVGQDEIKEEETKVEEEEEKGKGKAKGKQEEKEKETEKEVEQEKEKEKEKGKNKEEDDEKTDEEKTEDERESDAKWFWQSETKWIPYNADMCNKLERALGRGDKKVKFDTERYIDLENMCQRRYDSEGKKRNVKRVTEEKPTTKRKIENSDTESEGESESKPITQKKKMLKKGKGCVDPLFPFSSKCHIYERSGNVYDATLNQTSITQNNNKFYVIQVIESDDKKTWYCWNRWGRVGVGGQKQSQPFKNADEAVTAFCKKFKEKTGNSFDDRAHFVAHDGKYKMVEIDYGSDSSSEASTPVVDIKEKKKIKIPDSKLNPQVQTLVQLICDVKIMNEVLLEMDIDTTRMPLGKLSKKQITKGYDVLRQIEDAVLNHSSHKVLSEFSSEFYTVIPHSFGMKAPPVINSVKMLHDKMEMLESLSDLEIASKLLKEGSDSIDVNPIDTHYLSLKAEINPVLKGTKEWETLTRYIANTHGHTHDTYTLELLEVFGVSREGERARYEAFSSPIPNKKLLWHGSRLTNYMGIISQGLRIAPPESPSTGYMFGKGVYFADSCSKSANYCNTNKHNNVGIVILCEVALGNMYAKRQAEFITALKHGFQSTKGEGRYQPEVEEELTPGVSVPLGKLKDTGITDSALIYNEYVVYKVEQVCLKYLLKVKFHYKK